MFQRLYLPVNDSVFYCTCFEYQSESVLLQTKLPVELQHKVKGLSSPDHEATSLHRVIFLGVVLPAILLAQNVYRRDPGAV